MKLFLCLILVVSGCASPEGTGAAGTGGMGTSSAVTSTGTGGTGSMVSASEGHWPFTCPEGYLEECSGPEVWSTRCQTPGGEILACAEAAGVLVHCVSCASGFCARTGTVSTCCNPGDPHDPCLVSLLPCKTSGEPCLVGGVEGTCAGDLSCCNGCVDGAGACWHDFTDDAHCGVNGVACLACQAPMTCNQGACQ